MKKIIGLLMLLLTPIVVAAQQSFFNNALDEKYIINKYEMKKSQQSHHNSQFWLNVGGGIGTLGNESAAITAGISIQLDKNLFTLRAYRVAGNLVEDLYDIGLLYGRAISTESAQFSYAAGLSLVKGEKGVIVSNGITAERISTIGIPIELQANWELTNFIGLGITGFVNLNRAQSFAGITINLLIGKLR